MSGEMDQLGALDQEILRLLTSGWHTTEHAKSDGILSDEEIARRLNVSPEVVRDRLIFLEMMGYVINELSFGGDPTMTYRGVEQEGADLHRLAPRYHISEHGMRMALSDATLDGASEQPG